MNTGLSGMMAALLRRTAVLVPADRRDWAEAIWAEAALVPAGPDRLSWLAGGLRLTVGGLPRRLGYPLAFAVGHWGPVVGPGTRIGYVAGNSAFAAGYLIVLVLGPLLGCILGACGARAARPRRDTA